MGRPSLPPRRRFTKEVSPQLQEAEEEEVKGAVGSGAELEGMDWGEDWDEGGVDQVGEGVEPASEGAAVEKEAEGKVEEEQRVEV